MPHWRGLTPPNDVATGRVRLECACAPTDFGLGQLWAGIRPRPCGNWQEVA